MSKAAPNRLAGIIATKGEAQRPQNQPQRAAQPSPPAPAPAPQPIAVTAGVKSLTLRLPGDEYDRLRRFAFDNRTTHQDVLAAALREYLDGRV